MKIGGMLPRGQWWALVLGIILVAVYGGLSALEQARVGERHAFVEAYRPLAGKDTPDALQRLFATYMEQLGTSTLMSLIQEESPYCHEDGHELGKVVYRRSGKNLSDSFYACGRTCGDGCYHGVFMEAFIPGELRSEGFEHATAEEIRPLIENICTESRQAPDECAHATGHGLMLNLGVIDDALGLCAVFEDEKVRFWCETGVFMQHDLDFGEEAPYAEDMHAPCDAYAGRQAVACYRYKVQRMFAVEPDFTKVVAVCASLGGHARLGCFHGLGYAYSGAILEKPSMLHTVCEAGTYRSEILSCIDGAMENVTVWDPQGGEKACPSLAALGDPHFEQFCRSFKGKEGALERETLQLYF